MIDRLLKLDTPYGPVWRRYNGDGYGEYDDGAPHDGTGRGRPWPLLTGERGHYELAAGRDPLPYLQAMCGMAIPLGLIPEQVWDGEAVPSRHLLFGRPSGAARPLAWAHAEFAKLTISRQLGWPFDRPNAVWRRYQGQRPVARRAFWAPHAPIGEIAPGSRLIIALPRPALVRWRSEGGRSTGETATLDTGLGFHAAEIDTANPATDRQIGFGWKWREGTPATGEFYITVGAQEREAIDEDPDRKYMVPRRHEDPHRPGRGRAGLSAMLLRGRRNLCRARRRWRDLFAVRVPRHELQRATAVRAHRDPMPQRSS